MLHWRMKIIGIYVDVKDVICVMRIGWILFQSIYLFYDIKVNILLILHLFERIMNYFIAYVEITYMEGIIWIL